MTVKWFDQRIVDEDAGLEREGLRAAPSCWRLARDRLGQADRAGQRLLDQVADRAGAALLVRVVVEFAARSKIVSSAWPSVVVKICASTMLPPAMVQAPAMIDSRRGWSGASTVISVTASKARVRDRGGERACRRASASRMKSAWAILRGRSTRSQIGRVVALEIGGALGLRPVGERLGELGLGGGDAAVAADLAVAAGQHRLGLVVERAQQLALPAVPDAGADRLDVGDGEDQEQLQPLEASARRRRNRGWSCGR